MTDHDLACVLYILFVIHTCSSNTLDDPSRTCCSLCSVYGFHDPSHPRSVLCSVYVFFEHSIWLGPGAVRQCWAGSCSCRTEHIQDAHAHPEREQAPAARRQSLLQHRWLMQGYFQILLKHRRLVHGYLQSLLQHRWLMLGNLQSLLQNRWLVQGYMKSLLQHRWLMMGYLQSLLQHIWPVQGYLQSHLDNTGDFCMVTYRAFSNTGGFCRVTYGAYHNIRNLCDRLKYIIIVKQRCPAHLQESHDMRDSYGNNYGDNWRFYYNLLTFLLLCYNCQHNIKIV